MNSSRNNNLTSNNYTTKEFNLRSNSLKNRKLSSNILDQSIVPSIYSDKYYFKYGTKINDNLLKFRENTSKKYNARIKKEIDYLSNSFKNPMSKFTYTKNNKSIINNFDNFPLTYTTTVSSLKKYNRDKKLCFCHYCNKKKRTDKYAPFDYIREYNQMRNFGCTTG